MTAPQPPATTSTAGSDDTAFADDLALATEPGRCRRPDHHGGFRSAELQVMTKPDRTPVTEADQAVERMIRERLAARPADTVLGEEFGATGGLQGRSWIIDPIDGTANYLRGTHLGHADRAGDRRHADARDGQRAGDGSPLVGRPGCAPRATWMAASATSASRRSRPRRCPLLVLRRRRVAARRA